MHKTNRQLDQENKALRARLGAAAGETRRSLNDRVKSAEKAKRDADLEIARLTKLAQELKETAEALRTLRAEGVSNTPPKVSDESGHNGLGGSPEGVPGVGRL